MTKKFALCIGINDYPGSGNDLQGCVNDANDWSELLTDRSYVVNQLLDGAATKANISDSIAKLLQFATSRDKVIITYSGHGTWVPDFDGDEADGRDEALCPYDCITTGEVLTDDELYNLFMLRKEGVRLAFISDSCHSGSVSRFMSPLNFETMGWDHKIRFMAPELILKEGSRLLAARAVEAKPKRVGRSRQSALLLSGCKDDEYSYDARFGGRPNGAFTYAALSALKGLSLNASYRDWYSAIRGYLPAQDYPQTPQMNGSSTWKSWTPVL